MKWGFDIVCIERICPENLTWCFPNTDYAYSSMAVFGTDILAANMRIHPKVGWTFGCRNWRRT
jgi:hypothetical protein